MVKFGKELRTRIIEVWKDSYINYKRLKQLIKQIKLDIKNKVVTADDLCDLKDVSESLNELNEASANSFLCNEDIQKIISENKKGFLLKRFLTELDNEFHKMYVNFIQIEKELYGQINRLLYAQSNYIHLKIDEIKNEIESIHCTIYLAFSLKEFINDNITAFKKILKKFDKKFKKYFGYVSYSIFQDKLKTKNSDLEYMLQFKVIDEANIVIEDVIDYIVLILNSKKNKAEITKAEFNNLIDQTEIIKEYIYKSDHHIDYQIKNKDWFYYIREGEKIIKNNTDYLKNDIYNPLLSSSFSNDEILYKLLSNKAIKKLELHEIEMSLENNVNLILCFVHSIWSSALQTIIIPSTHIYLSKLNYSHYFPFYWGIVPLLSILSIFIFKFFKPADYKISFILSLVIYIIGNFIYCIDVNQGKHQMILICLSRALIGLGSNPLTAKKYVTEFVIQNKLTKISLLYFFLTSSGYALGPLLGLILNYLPEYQYKLLFIGVSRDTYIGLFGFLFSIIILIAFSLLFTKSDPKTLDIVSDTVAVDISNSSDTSKNLSSGECPLISTEEKEMIEALDSKLEKLNQSNNFSDMNKIPIYIQKNIEKERVFFSYLKIVFSICSLSYFISKIFCEFLIVFAAEKIYKRDKNKSTTNITYFISLIFGFLLMSVLSSFAGSIIQINKYARGLLLTSLTLSFIILLLFVIFAMKNLDVLYLIMYYLFLVVSTLIDIVVSNMISNIMPPKWYICGLDYGHWIGYSRILGQVIGCLYLFVFLSLNHNISFKYQTLIDIFISSVGPISYFLLIVAVLNNYKLLRVKAISRVIRNNQMTKL